MEIIKSAVKGGENMNVLIIGGMGVIGGAITKAAIKKGIDVSVVSRRAIFGEWLELGINGIQGDWKDDVFAEKVVKKGYDVIVDTQVFNVDQLKRSLNIANNHCKQYIYISTDSVYEHPAENLSEDDPIDMNKIYWDYGIDKRKGELYLLEYGNKYNFFWTGIRPTITFGDTRIPVGYATKRNTYTLAERILEGKPIIRFDDPSTRHAVCHSSIFGCATVGLFLNKKAAGQFYHISDDYAYTYGEIFEAIEKVLGKKGVYVNVPTKLIKKYSRSVYEEMIYDKNPEFVLDNSKIKQVSQDAVYHVNIEEVMETTLKFLEQNSKFADEEYNYITDNILVEYFEKIENQEIKEKVHDYISKMSKDYRKDLGRFKSKRKVDDFLYPLKKCKHKMVKIIKNH